MEEANPDCVEKMDQKRLSGDDLKKTSRLRQEYEASLGYLEPQSQTRRMQSKRNGVGHGTTTKLFCGEKSGHVNASRASGTGWSKVKALKRVLGS